MANPIPEVVPVSRATHSELGMIFSKGREAEWAERQSDRRPVLNSKLHASGFAAETGDNGQIDGDAYDGYG